MPHYVELTVQKGCLGLLRPIKSESSSRSNRSISQREKSEENPSNKNRNSDFSLPRNFPGKIKFSWNQLHPFFYTYYPLAAVCICFISIVENVERGRTGDRSTVLRGAEPVPGGDRAAERYLWRSDGSSDPANVLSGHSCSFQLPLLRQYWSHPYQVNIIYIQTPYTILRFYGL